MAYENIKEIIKKITELAMDINEKTILANMDRDNEEEYGF